MTPRTHCRISAAGLPDFGGPQPRRGFGLVMMMLVVAILAVFIVVSARLTTNVLGIYRDAGRIDTEARSVDAALLMLRQDVWGARRVAVAGPQSVSIERGGARAVSWTVQTDGSLVRSDPDAGGDAASRRWRDVGGRLTFEWDGVALTLRGADKGADRTVGVRMMSQLTLADAGGTR